MTPLIIYVPGLLPKPEARLHRDALYRCLLGGIRRIDAATADDIDTVPRSFDIVSWTYDFYGEHRDISHDLAAIDAVIEQDGATPDDIAEATSWRRRLVRRVYMVGDHLPFLIPHIANERMDMHLRDLRRYLTNYDDIGEHTRQMFKIPVRAATEAKRPILVIAHSMGSVIAYDGLWQMSRNERDHAGIDLLLTMGSPLGQNYMQKRIMGHAESGADRYPSNIRRWINLAAIGDLTAIDPVLANDFREMIETGLVDELRDIELHNYFRLHGELNVHAEYGYLVNAATARVVSDWWRKQRHESDR